MPYAGFCFASFLPANGLAGCWGDVQNMIA
jgi:hypothetical protein